MLRCADLLMCNNQLVVAAKRLEEALQCGLLAPAAAYICSKGPGHHTAGPLSSSHANQRSIFQQCLAEEQLHQQQYLQHRAMNLATALQERMEYPLYGLWSPLWHWTLRKLLYCMQQGGQWVEYRIVLANLLVPTSADGVNRVPLQPESLLQDLLREFISLSTVASTSAVDSVNSRAVEAEHAVEAADASSAPPPPVLVPESPKQHQQRFAGLPVLRLPLGNYFGISVGMIRTAAAAKASDVVDAGAGTAGAGAASPSDGTTNDENHDPEPVLVQGFQVVREEWLPVAAMQCEGGRGDGYCLPVTLVSKLPGPVPVDSFVVVYRRFDAEGIVHQVLHAEDKNLHQNSSHEDCFKASADEFVCAPMALQQPTAEGSKAVLMLEPGVHNICMRFHPPTLGDYRLDRILLSVGSAVFESHLLPALSDTSSHLYPHPYMASAQANTGGTSLDAMFGDETTRNGAGVAMSLTRGEDTSMTNGGMDDAAGSGRMFTAGEGRALAVLKEFFKEHSIIQVLPPPDLLQLCASLSSAVPLQQEDDAYFTLRTFSADVIHNLTVTVCGAGGGGVGGYSSAGGDSGSLFLTRGAAGELGSAQNALKLAHGSRAVSGFISEENATPAARRKRVEQHNALDEEEVQAMASATAAVASLLAQQARDRDASSKRGMGTGAVAGNAVVTVADPAHWAAFASDIGACADSGDSRDSSVSLDPVTFERTSDISVDPPSVGIQIPQLPSNKRLHLRVPFTVAAAEGCASGGEAALSIELKGLLVRGPCRIPISLRKKVSVRALQPVTMLLEPFVLEAESGAAGNVATRDVLLQARLRNNTEVALELTSYGLASVAAFAPSPSPSPTTTACFILDGPSELSCLKGDQNHEKEMGESAPLQVVELQPAEEFPAGLIVRFPAEASPPAGGKSLNITSSKIYCFCINNNKII